MLFVPLPPTRSAPRSGVIFERRAALALAACPQPFGEPPQLDEAR
ncbi:MAG TPA: hypothetical protein VF041_04550 [Gemmatimonadaceae bacterium]